MTYFHALATDYDGTIAHDGVLDDATAAALERLKRSGRRLVTVTGRELPDLQRVCPHLDLFDRVVAENGALLYTPATKEIGKDSLGLIETLSRAFDRSTPALPERGPEVGEAIYWECRSDVAPVLIRVDRPKGEVKRHTRKYAQGVLGEDRSFFFRGPEGRLNIRAHNLAMFLDIGDRGDPDTDLFHLRRGDIETWMRTSVKDEDLADEVAVVAANEGLDLAEARALVRTAVEQRYTAPAGPE